MKLEDIVRPAAVLALPIYAAMTFFSTPVYSQPNSDSMYHFMVGNLQGKNDNLKAALKNYKKALEKDPDSSYLNNVVAEFLMDSARIDDAVPYLKKAVKLDKDYIQPHVNLSMVYVLKKNFKGAIGEASFILSNEPENLVALSIAAESYFKLKDHSRARSYFKKIVDLDVTAESVIHSTYRIGQLNFLDGNYFLAIVGFKKAFIMLDRTDPFDRLIGCDILYDIVLSYFKMGKYNDAKETIVTLDTLMGKEVNPIVIKGLNELRERIKKENLIRKIDEGIQSMNNKANPSNAIPK